MDYIKSRLSETSTYTGLAILLGLFGVHVQPELIGQIGTGVAAIIGLVQTFLPDQNK